MNNATRAIINNIIQELHDVAVKNGAGDIVKSITVDMEQLAAEKLVLNHGDHALRMGDIDVFDAPQPGAQMFQLVIDSPTEDDSPLEAFIFFLDKPVEKQKLHICMAASAVWKRVEREIIDIDI